MTGRLRSRPWNANGVFVTRNTGPGQFTREEAARILRSAATQLDNGAGWVE